MEKIPTMYERDEATRGRSVKPVIKPNCRWVEDGEGFATRKLDGTNVKVEGGVLWKRQKPADGDYDNAAYVPARLDDPADRYLFEAFQDREKWEDGIYEALGPKIQGNPEKYGRHALVRVVPVDPSLIVPEAPRAFNALRDYLSVEDIEGFVFHHPDGRKAKIKKRDFGFRR